ncbi:MAG: hypothetical protein RJQ08_07800 [Salinisphaeraceae bacterium]
MLFLDLLLGVVATGYAHWGLPATVRSTGQVVVARSLLAFTGLGTGLIAMNSLTDRPAWLAFAVGFGVIHIPAAAIIYLKRQR